jgi:sacsin
MRVVTAAAGFNVAYHFTDCPSFVSNDQLVLFDPHRKFLPAGLPGLRCGFLDGTNCADLLDQLEPFVRAAAVLAEPSAPRPTQPAEIRGTIFRLPLRTPEQAATSLISTAVVDCDTLNSQLLEFSR